LVFYKKNVIIFIEKRKRRLFLMRKKQVVPTAYDEAVQEFHKANAVYQHAQANFANALPEYFDIANRELSIARASVDLAMRKVKLLSRG
jgi:hypothetical protein